MPKKKAEENGNAPNVADGTTLSFQKKHEEKCMVNITGWGPVN